MPIATVASCSGNATSASTHTVDVDAPRVLSSAAFVGKIKNFEWAASGFKDLH